MEGEKMTRTRKIVIFLAFAAFCWVIVAGWAVVNGRLGSSVNPVYNDVYNSMELNAGYTYQYTGKIDGLSDGTTGAILPAPGADSVMTARTMAGLSEVWSTKLVLVIAFADDLGHNAVSSWYDWQTPFGIVQVDGNAISHLLEQGAVIDSAKVGKVKEMREFLPYFSCYFPDKRITPLVFDSAAGMDYVTSFLNGLASRNDGYKVLILTPYQKVRTTLFTDDLSLLRQTFEASSVTNLGGILGPSECYELNAMKYILQYDGNTVVGVIGNDAVEDLSFDRISVFYGKDS